MTLSQCSLYNVAFPALLVRSDSVFVTIYHWDHSRRYQITLAKAEQSGVVPTITYIHTVAGACLYDHLSVAQSAWSLAAATGPRVPMHWVRRCGSFRKFVMSRYKQSLPVDTSDLATLILR